MRTARFSIFLAFATAMLAADMYEINKPVRLALDGIRPGLQILLTPNSDACSLRIRFLGIPNPPHAAAPVLSNLVASSSRYQNVNVSAARTIEAVTYVFDVPYTNGWVYGDLAIPVDFGDTPSRYRTVALSFYASRGKIRFYLAGKQPRPNQILNAAH